MVSSASAQIEASEYTSSLSMAGLFLLIPPAPPAGGEHSRTTIQGQDGPKDVPNYALIQAIFIGSVSAYVIVLALIGPEKHGSHFEKGKTAFQAGASEENVNSTPPEVVGIPRLERLSVEMGKEKEVFQLTEPRMQTKDSFV